LFALVAKKITRGTILDRCGGFVDQTLNTVEAFESAIGEFRNDVTSAESPLLSTTAA
jgi:hypothetical protein